MADIFVSYSRKNMSTVRELVHFLEKKEWDVFWDRDMEAGSDFEKHLEQELAAASVVLVVWSEHSVESSWVRAEANDGLTRNCLVPVRLDDSVLPLMFRALETIDISGWPFESRMFEMRKLAASIEATLNPGESEAKDSPFKNLPLRDDPSLSTRVAQRVMSKLDTKQGAGEKDALQLKMEMAVNDASLCKLQSNDKTKALEILVNRLLESTGGVWAQVESERVSIQAGEVDRRAGQLDIIRKSEFSGVQPLDLNDLAAGYALRLISDDKSELIVVMNHYLELNPEIVHRLATSFKEIAR